ncbi:hypothetical protein [Flavobacterium caeni]|uniref:hypothetical protein n=1 Tax=Flavobacterium caeni TaxID=490189 RepID=UPI0011131DD8|nr:hypothetical protein [Flavobacterium caeni]
MKDLLDKFWLAFTLRFFGFTLLGLLGLLIIILINLIINKFRSKKIDIKKLALTGTIIIVFGNLIGTLIFFF